MPELEFISVFKSGIILRLNENLKRISICLDKLEEAQVWHKINDHTNSIGNLVLHLNGNIKQYVISGLGSETDIRQRKSEFDHSIRLDKKDLFKQHTKVIKKAILLVKDLDGENLTETLSIQGFELSACDAIIHVVEHYSYHCGQIALLRKIHLNTDLGFYKDHDLNKLNT